MKIDLKLTNDALIACNSLIKGVYDSGIYPDTEAGKLIKSICFDVADKLDSKCKSLVKKASLFDTKKKQNITLKYHEAWGLSLALIQLNENEINDYKRIAIAKIITDLHQKLA